GPSTAGRPCGPAAREGAAGPPAALIQRFPGKTDDVERVHHTDRLGQLLGGRRLEATETIHGYHFHSVAPGLGPFGQPGLERLLGASLDHVKEPGRAGAVPDWVRSMITVTNLSP